VPKPDLPDGSYNLTFGDFHDEKNPGGISKRGEAHRRGGMWRVEGVHDTR
jgi:hypothetical protein